LIFSDRPSSLKRQRFHTGKRSFAESLARGGNGVAGKTAEMFPNCPRYIHKMTLVEESAFVPKNIAKRRRQPGSGWKLSRMYCLPRCALGWSRARCSGGAKPQIV